MSVARKGEAHTTAVANNKKGKEMTWEEIKKMDKKDIPVKDLPVNQQLALSYAIEMDRVTLAILISGILDKGHDIFDIEFDNTIELAELLDKAFNLSSEETERIKHTSLLHMLETDNKEKEDL